MRKVAQFNPEYAVIDDITGTKANGEKKPTFQLRRIKFCGRGEKWLVKRKVRVRFACVVVARLTHWLSHWQAIRDRDLPTGKIKKDDENTYDSVVFAPSGYIYQAFEQSAISYWTQNPYKWHYIDFVEDKALQIKSLRWCPRLTTGDHERLGGHAPGQLLYESMLTAGERESEGDLDRQDGADLPLGWWEGQTANGRIM